MLTGIQQNICSEWLKRHRSVNRVSIESSVVGIHYTKLVKQLCFGNIFSSPLMDDMKNHRNNFYNTCDFLLRIIINIFLRFTLQPFTVLQKRRIEFCFFLEQDFRKAWFKLLCKCKCRYKGNNNACNK